MKQSAAIYPYGKDDVQLFRYAHLIEDFKPACPVSPLGWGQAGMDAAAIDGGTPIGCPITTNLEHALDQTDLLVLTSFKNFHGKTGNFDTVISLAAQKGKPTIILELPVDYDQEQLATLQACGLMAKMYPPPPAATILANPTRKKPGVPVVLIFGEGPSTDKFEVQLALRDELLRRNYRITQVGSRSYGELFGFHSFPAFMGSKQYSEAEKIIKFNQQLKYWEDREKPDLIIIGTPLGIVPVTEDLHNDFGMTLLEVAAASEPDLLVNTLYHLDYLPEFFALKAHHNAGTFGSETGCFVLSRTWLDVMGTKTEKTLKTIKLRQTKQPLTNLHNTQKFGDFPVIALQQSGAAGAIADAVIAKLQSYSQVNTV